MDEDDVGEPTGLGGAPCVLFIINYSSIEYYCTLIVYNLFCWHFNVTSQNVLAQFKICQYTNR